MVSPFQLHFHNALPPETTAAAEEEEEEGLGSTEHQSSPQQVMAGLWWVTVTLTLILYSGCSAGVDQNHLRSLVEQIRKYGGLGMSCVAVSIPGGTNLMQVINDNPLEDVQRKINKGDVYKGDRLVAAKVKTPEHAEWRVLKDIKLDSNKGDLLIIYSYASSCPTTCTNPNNWFNIIDKIKNLINTGNWADRAFVFETIFKPEGTIKIEPEALIEALKNLGQSGIPLANIFRCYYPKNKPTGFQCVSCSNNGAVTKQCIDYNA